MSKSKMAYCKAHGKFDDCSSKVAKAAKMDDGIHHLTGVTRVKSSPEDRAHGALVPLLTGKRQVDGTPMMGHAPGASKITENDKGGSSKRSKKVGGSGVREQVVKADRDNPFAVEVSKADGRMDTSVAASKTPGKKVEAAYPPEVKAYIADHEKKISKADAPADPFEVSKGMGRAALGFGGMMGAGAAAGAPIGAGIGALKAKGGKKVAGAKKGAKAGAVNGALLGPLAIGTLAATKM